MKYPSTEFPWEIMLVLCVKQYVTTYKNNDNNKENTNIKYSDNVLIYHPLLLSVISYTRQRKSYGILMKSSQVVYGWINDHKQVKIANTKY